MADAVALTAALRHIWPAAVENDPGTVGRHRRLLRALELQYRIPPVLLVGGTNGKGSVCYMLVQILRHAGYRVALLAKPHLLHFNERCQVDGVPITDDELVEAVGDVLRCAAKHRLTGLRPAETRYAAFLSHVVRRGANVLVCEVNEGGRHDATAALSAAIAVVTNVGLDHEDTLGPSLREIAWHKAGLTCSSAVLYTGAKGDALRVLQDEAQRCGTEVVVVGEGVRLTNVSSGPDGTDATVEVPDRAYRVHTPLLGVHQAGNAALAVAVADRLATEAWRIGEAEIVSGIRAAAPPARFQIVRGAEPVIIVDGAHNQDKAAALACTLRERYPGMPLTVVLATTSARLRAVAPPLLADAQLLLAPDVPFPRAAPPDECVKFARARGVPARVARSMRDALADAAAQGVGRPPLVVVTGTFAAAGAALAAMPHVAGLSRVPREDERHA